MPTDSQYIYRELMKLWYEDWHLHNVYHPQQQHIYESEMIRIDLLIWLANSETPEDFKMMFMTHKFIDGLKDSAIQQALILTCHKKVKMLVNTTSVRCCQAGIHLHMSIRLCYCVVFIWLKKYIMVLLQWIWQKIII